MTSDRSKLDVSAFGLAAGVTAAALSSLCAAALAVAPQPTRALAGYLIHSDLSSVTPVVSWFGFFVSAVGWALIAGVAFAVAAALYNRFNGPRAA